MDSGFKTGLIIGGLAVAVIGLAVALVLTSGGDDDDGDATTTAETTATSTATDTATTTDTQTTTATDPQPDQSDIVSFTTPTGNIVCKIAIEAATCGIFDFTYTPPPDTIGCGVERWGHAVSVGLSGRGDFVCRNGPPTAVNSPPLAYGSRQSLGPFRCASSKLGVLCENNDTGHGFALSSDQFGRR